MSRISYTALRLRGQRAQHYHGFLRRLSGTFRTIDFPGATGVMWVNGKNGGNIVGYYISDAIHGFLKHKERIRGQVLKSSTGISA